MYVPLLAIVLSIIILIFKLDIRYFLSVLVTTLLVCICFPIIGESLICKDFLNLSKSQCVLEEKVELSRYSLVIQISKIKNDKKINRSVFSNSQEIVSKENSIFIEMTRFDYLNSFWLIEALNNGPKYKKITEEFLNGT